jgi:hypothetical protein
MAWGLLWSLEEAFRTRLSGSPLQLWDALRIHMTLALAWAIATPGIIWSVRKWPLERSTWAMHLPIHLLLSSVYLYALIVLYQVVAGAVGVLRPSRVSFLERSFQEFLFWFLSDSLLYWAVIFIDWGIRQLKQVRDRELRASHLETQLAEARLSALKAQLHPHFLFNALHTIGTLVRTGRAALAVRVVAELGDLLRAMLDDATTQEVPLRRELAFVRNYLEIEQIRFSDRLDVVFAVDDDTLDAKVPHLILQPLVENAIRHGIAPHGSGGRLVIAARRENGRLLLDVTDDGRGLEDGNGREPTDRPGLGLQNVRDRLTQLFGGESSVTLVPGPAGGAAAQVRMPFRLATPSS